jgi:hypothetical protein
MYLNTRCISIYLKARISFIFYLNLNSNTFYLNVQGISSRSLWYVGETSREDVGGLDVK